MPGMGNNLYPPIINTWMPAFVRTKSCRVYFSLSIYNNNQDIANAQVIVNNQFDNRSALDANKYPTGIKICQIGVDNDILTDDKYYIEINPSDLTSGVFELNQFYKVQIRFTGAGASLLASQTQIAAWLTANQRYFSEWSTVCLIKGIEQPHIYLKGFESDNSRGEYELSFMTEVIDLVGHMYYDNNSDIEKEALKYYHVMLYNANTDEVVYNSGDIYTNVYNPNEINHTLKVNLENGTRYRLKFTYTTTNEYTESIQYYFSILQNSIDVLQATITATPDIEYGRVAVNVKATIQEAFFGNLTIRRASSETNFTVWEDVHQVSLANGQPLNYTWYDYTVESGVWYRYGAQRRNTKGDRGTLIFVRQPVLVDLDDMFLTRAGMQFRVRFDPSVTSFKYTYSEVKVDTLGAQYPHFRRNGNVKYRAFPIGGLITAFCDDQGIFLNKNNIYKEAKNDYDLYNQEQNIDEYQDYIYEREFREKIMDFLYADDIKLFRSPTEGNILVRLMDVSFTPNQTLGRMLYSFTANAYEIDDCSLANFERYGIQTIGEYSNDLTYHYEKLGQLTGTYSGNNAKNELVSLLRDHYEKATLNNNVVELFAVKWLRVEFISDPYLIQTTADGRLVKATDRFNENMAEGYIMYVNGKPMIVSPRRFIEFIDDDVNITSVYFPYATEVTFDYIVELEQRENTALLYNKIYFYTKVGQMHDTFKPLDNIFRQIYVKYLLNYTKYHQELIAIDKLIVEADPGTVLQVRDSFDEDYFEHEIGGTGVLQFYDDEAVITGLNFAGVHLYPVEDTREQILEVINNETAMHPLKDGILKVNDAEDAIIFETKYFTSRFGTDIIVKDTVELGDGDYFDTGISVRAESKVRQPQDHGVYTINGKRMIWYKGEYYEFGDNDIVQCPIEATIDYIYEKMRGEY